MSNDNKSGLKPQQSHQQQPSSEASADARIAELERQLQEARDRADAAVNRSQQLEAAGSDRPNYSDKVAKPASDPKRKQHWEFAVKCTGMPKGHPAIEPATIKAVDESEAIRLFCLTRKDDKGRQLDPTRYQFQAVCLQQRERDQLALNRVNNRRALEFGRLPLALTREESFLPVEENIKRQKAAMANS